MTAPALDRERCTIAFVLKLIVVHSRCTVSILLSLFLCPTRQRPPRAACVLCTVQNFVAIQTGCQIQLRVPISRRLQPRTAAKSLVQSYRLDNCWMNSEGVVGCERETARDRMNTELRANAVVQFDEAEALALGQLTSR